MPNETLLKFRYPQTLIREYRHWVVLLRPKQVTAGSLVIVSSNEATALSELTESAFSELCTVTAHTELALGKAFNNDKINYLALMMVDKHVHFHVLPRYAAARNVCGVTFEDSDWPNPPDLTKATELDRAQFEALLKDLQNHWPE